VSTHRSAPQSTEQGPSVPADGATASLTLRRRLLRGGLSAVPVLMTVASRPALGQECFTASGQMSVLSSHANNLHDCSQGFDAQGWEQKLSGSTTSTSSSGYYMEAKSATASPSATDTSPLFGSVFGAGSYSDMTFLQVLQAGKDDSVGTAGLAAHLVAAVLNARAGLTPPGVLDEGLAKEIWHSFSMRSYFEPTAGVQWNIAQTIEWLKTTMPLSG
jgi:hypothetical protein